MFEKDRIKSMVRGRYGNFAGRSEQCCDTDTNRQSSCCTQAESASDTITPPGFYYSDKEVCSAPAGSFMGLGCGNPLALVELRAGETVLDLGSGGGFDCFLAAQRVGGAGKVIGIDMTPEMVNKARSNAELEGFDNVVFRLGELESLPVDDESVDVVISNCVVNLSPDKPRVFAETFRVLKPKGRLMVMDMVAKASIPDRLREDPNLYCGCISGAVEAGEIRAMLAESGFRSIRISLREQSPMDKGETVNEDNVHDFVSSASIMAVKPGGSSINNGP